MHIIAGMNGGERINGHPEDQSFDRLARSKQIVDLLFAFPVDLDKSKLVVDAVGTVYADFKVLDDQQKLMRQLATEVTSHEVLNAIEDAKRAALLRTQDGTMSAETLEEHRLLVLGGLDRILQATRFNEKVGRTKNGITIVQIGISPHEVEDTIEHVQEAAEVSRKMLGEGEQKKIIPKIPESDIDILDVPPIQIEPEPPEDIVDTPGPRLQTLLDIQYEEAMTRAGLRPKPSEIHQPMKPGRPQPGRELRRKIIFGGLKLGTVAAVFVPIGLWAQDAFFLPDEERIRRENDFIDKNPLTEKESNLSGKGWTVSYPILKEGESFEDIFEGMFKQTTLKNDIPLYVRQGDDSVFKEYIDIKAESAHRLGQKPLVKLTFNGVPFQDGDNHVLSGKRSDGSAERSFPSVVKFSHHPTGRVYYLSFTPVDYKGDWVKYMNEVLYMRLVSTK